MTTMLYAAYGSNLDQEDLARWCAENGRSMPLTEPVAVGWLPDRRPAFSAFGARRRGGVLDALPSLGALTPCAMYEVDDEALRTLDIKESAGVLYRRIETVALTNDLGAITVVTYEVLPERRQALVAPTADYVEVVRRGLVRCGHDTVALIESARGNDHAATLDKVFVYGTFCPGECRHHILHEHGLRGTVDATVPGLTIDLGRYPGLLPPEDPSDRSHGVLATIGDVAGLLVRLDHIEEFGGWDDPQPLYWRRLAVVESGSARALAWTYLYARPVGEAIARVSGRWTAIGRDGGGETASKPPPD